MKKANLRFRIVPRRYGVFAAGAFLLFFCLSMLLARKGAFIPLVFLLPLVFWIDVSSLYRAIKSPIGLSLSFFWAVLLLSALILNPGEWSKLLELALMWSIAFFFASFLKIESEKFSQGLLRGFVVTYGVALVFVFSQHVSDFFLLRVVLGWGAQKIIADFGATMAPMAMFSFLFFAGLILKGRYLLAFVSGILLLVSLVLSPFSSALIAFVLGVASFFLVFLLKKTGAVLVQGAIAAFVLLAPFAIAPMPSADQLIFNGVDLPQSWAHRIEIWRFTSGKTLEAPLAGHGFKSSRQFKDMVEVRGREMVAMPLHPHNAALQIWLELGLVGVVAFLGFWAFLSAALLRLGAQIGRVPFGVVMATLSSMFVISVLSFGFWQTSWQALLVTGVVFIALYKEILLFPKPNH